jgi:uncharacterized RDD family membrane protein YckC
MSAISPAWDARGTELELPEEINLQLEVANVGSRTLAILADITLCGLVLLLVYSITFVAARDMAGDWITQLGSGALQMVLILAVFGFQWVYFNLFEWLWNGQTPGKRLMHLRVIKMDGAPVSWIDVFLRNIARPIDTFGPMGLIGLLMIFISQKAQRLGDLMARTLVIHETPIDWSIFDQLEANDGEAASRGPTTIRLTPAQWELLHRFLNRREQLQPEARNRLAASLHDSLKSAAAGTELERSPLAPEDWLVELARRT